MKTYIVDIDGTLADLSHRLHHIQKEPKDWDAFFDGCEEDEPIQNVIDVVRQLGTTQGNRIVYLTGRPERVRGKTICWLSKNGLPERNLVMRKNGDHRPDTIAKRELLEKLQSEGHEIVGVFEDRPTIFA